MKSLREIEQVGWLFFAVTFAVLTAPCAYLTYTYTFNTASVFSRITAGLFLAGILAAVISSAVNEVLHRRNTRRAKARKKEQKRNKR